MNPIRNDSASEPGATWLILAGVWLAVFYSHLPIYLTMFVNPAIRPAHWMYALGVMLFVIWCRPVSLRQTFSAALPGWIAAYTTICLVWFCMSGGSDAEAIRLRVVAMLFLLVTFMVVSASQCMVRLARQAILVVVLISVAVNAFEIANPFVLIPAESEFALLGRAGGFYTNPNQAGAALVLGLILTIGFVPSRLRVVYLVYVSMGVVLTLSRAAMLGLAVVTAALWIKRVITTKQVVLAGLLGTAMLWIATMLVLPALSERFGVSSEVALDRVLWILDPESRADFSQLERIYLADKGWQQFLESPIIGNGIGSTELWDERTSTHNTYISLLSDFGVIGVALIPLLLLAVVRIDVADPPERLAFVLFILLSAALSHGVLMEYYYLIGFAVMAAMCHRTEPNGSSAPSMNTTRAVSG